MGKKSTRSTQPLEQKAVKEPIWVLSSLGKISPTKSRVDRNPSEIPELEFDLFKLAPQRVLGWSEAVEVGLKIEELAAYEAPMPRF